MKKAITIYFLCFGFVCSIYSQSYKEMVQRSVEYLGQKDYPAAEQALKAAMKSEPANPDNYKLSYNLGMIQQELKKYDEALVSYSIALSKYPTSNPILHSRATLFCEVDSLDSAMKDYNAILLSDNKDMEALYKRGLIYLDKKEFAKAEDDFNRILEIEPSNLTGKSGVALVMKRKGEWKQAEDYYSDLIYENRTNADLYLNRCECYIELNKLARAQEDINKAFSYGDIDNPTLYVIRGQLKLRQYDRPAAKEDFLKAQELGANPILVDELLKHCK